MTVIEQGFAPANVKKRNINIDFLKFIACLAVVGLHTLQKDLSFFNASLYHLCGFAIPVFFFSSGYILLQRKEITIRYCLRKCLNMIRVVLLWSVCIAAGIVFLKLLQGETVEWPSLFRDATYRPLIQKGFLWQFWYFGAMILMYLLLPFIHRVIYNNKIGWQKLWSIFAVVCVCIQIVSLRRNSPVQKEVIQTFRMWTWIQYFSLGGGYSLFIFISKNLSIKKHVILLIGWTAFQLVYQYIIGEWILYNIYAEYFYDSFFEIVWIILIVSLLLRIDVTPLEKYITFLSPLTMGVFIIHPLINSVCGHFITIDSVLLAVGYFAFVSAVSFVITYLLSKFPFSRYMLKI